MRIVTLAIIKNHKLTNNLWDLFMFIILVVKRGVILNNLTANLLFYFHNLSDTIDNQNIIAQMFPRCHFSMNFILYCHPIVSQQHIDFVCDQKIVSLTSHCITVELNRKQLNRKQ